MAGPRLGPRRRRPPAGDRQPDRDPGRRRGRHVPADAGRDAHRLVRRPDRRRDRPLDGPAVRRAPTTARPRSPSSPACRTLGPPASRSATRSSPSAPAGTRASTSTSSVDGGPARSIHHHAEILAVAGLSRDESLLALEHAEHGDSMHFALRVVRPATGETVADLWDGPGTRPACGRVVAGGRATSAWPSSTSAAAGIGRASGTSTTGERTDLDLDLPGDVARAGLVAGRLRPAAAARTRRPLRAVPARRCPATSCRASSIRPARSRARAFGPTAPSGTGTPPATARPRSARPRAAARCCRSRAEPPRRGARTCRGRSRIRTATACTAST